MAFLAVLLLLFYRPRRYQAEEGEWPAGEGPRTKDEALKLELVNVAPVATEEMPVLPLETEERTIRL